MAENSNHDQVLDSCYRASTDPHMKTLVPIPSELGMIARTFGSCMLSAGADSRACTAWSTSFSSISQESNSIDWRNLLFQA